jgi:hypothetical protein
MKPAVSPRDVISGLFLRAASEQDTTLTHYVLVGGGVEPPEVWL